jgi:hypothetical protein
VARLAGALAPRLSSSRLLIAAGCGGSSSAQEEPDASTLEAALARSRRGRSRSSRDADFGPARCGSRSSSSTARARRHAADGQGLARARPEASPFAQTTAVRAIGVGETEPGEPTDVFVAHLQLPEAGTYWVLAEPVGGRKIQAVGTVVVKDETTAPAVGAKAIPSKTPTLADSTLEQLTTSNTPDKELYRSSVATRSRRRSRSCSHSRRRSTAPAAPCGPVVDVVSAVRRKHEGDGIRFINVEITRTTTRARARTAG